MENKGKRTHALIWTTAVLLIVALCIVIYYLKVWRFEEYTNDSYVSGNMTVVNPQIPGIVMSIHVDNTDYVEKGQLLIELDPTDYQIEYERSEANLGEIVREVKQMFDVVKQYEADLIAREAELIRAEQDYQNRVNLVGIGGVSKEDFEHIQANLSAAKAFFESTFFALQGAKARVANTQIPTHPKVLRAAQEFKDAYVNLKRTQILAPVSGYVAQRQVQIGEQIERGTPLLSVVPLGEIWVEANFKENQLAKMRVGQAVKITADIYGRSVVFHGHLMGLNPGTGAVFSILPPQNATGNWIKIVQRLPVRVILDKEEIKVHPLMLGMSTEATVDLRDQRGPILRQAQPLKALYETNIYPKQEDGADDVIGEIIRMNS
ncbi:MAG: efflux RND transporter periplasmic adaptor subunit [Simkaniaceae bacterium]|nr:efflux RND transporter periplasmic adaptor subunit [Simkaniaceae bacterium]